jgi:hypothetical protein
MSKPPLCSCQIREALLITLNQKSEYAKKNIPSRPVGDASPSDIVTKRSEFSLRANIQQRMGFSPNKRRRSASSEAACAGWGKIPSRHNELSRATRLLQRPSPCLPGDYNERLANSFSYLSPQSDNMYRVGQSIVD